jgi:thioredoxin reductase (NADPH)
MEAERPLTTTVDKKAPKPLILAVDDESAVLGAVARDLRRAYGGHYRIARAGSGAEAVEVVEEARLRGEAIALFLVDQRMPAMSGLEFLARAREHYPDAKRVLLTAYADTDASIRAINETRLDYYLMKPWDPPEERLYPVIDDLLDDWQASFQPPFQGVRVIGHPWSAATHAVKDFLARNLVPFRWLDVERDAEAQELIAVAGAEPTALPLVLLPDGTPLARPSSLEIAERIGLRTRPELPFYDLVIVGAGPAGLAAAVYGASEGLKTLLIEAEAPGGQAGLSASIENYLGFPVGLSGSDLARRAVTQARRFGAEILTPLEATGVRIEDPFRFVTLSDGSELGCHALLIATGVSYRTLDVPGADRFAGAGLFYGSSITEALTVADAPVFIVGGGNSAGQAAMYLARFASRVTVVVRGSSLAASMSQYLIAQIDANEKVELRTRSQLAELHGDERLERVSITDLDDGTTEVLEGRGVFVFIGAAPRTGWLADVVECDEKGFILSGPELVRGGRRPRGWTLRRDPLWLETSVPGVFVAGDVRSRSVKRVASAVGEGAMAVQFVHQHLSGQS